MGNKITISRPDGGIQIEDAAAGKMISMNFDGSGVPEFTSAGNTGKTVKISLAQLGNNEAVEFREVDVCVDGTPMKMKVLGTAPYSPP